MKMGIDLNRKRIPILSDMQMSVIYTNSEESFPDGQVFLYDQKYSLGVSTSKVTLIINYKTQFLDVI